MKKKRSFVIWFTGLSGSGKSTLATGLSKYLESLKIKNIILDGDIMRQGLCKDLGFSKEDREENCRRIAEVARLLLQVDTIPIVPVISPYIELREKMRKLFGPEEFIEVYVECPLYICEQRDVKGLYQKARDGKIPFFTGISDPYEPPEDPEITVNTSEFNSGESLDRLLSFVRPWVQKTAGIDIPQQ